MPNIKTMMGSKYLKKEDLQGPALMTVAHIDQQEVSDGDGKTEFKWCMHLKETDKPLILNSTNLQLAAQAFGSDETDNWHGRQIVLYVDPNVSMGGKLVGGIRVRAPKNRVAQPAQPTPAAPTPAAPTPPQPSTSPAQRFSDMEDDIPF